MRVKRLLAGLLALMTLLSCTAGALAAEGEAAMMRLTKIGRAHV